MFPTVTLPYKILGVVLLLVGVFASGYYKGYSGEHDKLTTFEAQVSQKADDQKLAAIAKDKQNAEITNSIVQTWSADHKRLSAAIAGMRNAPSSSTVPQAADSQQKHDDNVSVEGGTCSRSFYNKALDTELLLETWQEWALEMGIPVED